MVVLFFTGMPGWAEIVVIGFVGLLLFGRRLPEVGRSLGRTIVEFKRGIKEVESDVNVASRPRDDDKPTLPPGQKPGTPQLGNGEPQPETPRQDSSLESQRPPSE